MSQSIKRHNFLNKFRHEFSNDLKTLSSIEFIEIWNHYDADGNGFIEDKELDSFLRELSAREGAELIPESILHEIKRAFLDAYDENQDGKISVQEMAEILPTEENFLVLFRRENWFESGADFFKIWTEFDRDKSGFIESDELKRFVVKSLEKSNKKNVSDEKIMEYTEAILKLYDSNNDGKLQLSEMIKLLSPKENIAVKRILNACSAITNEDLDKIFYSYDTVIFWLESDKNEEIEDSELNMLAKDLLEITKKDYTAADLVSFKNGLLATIDFNQDGKINKNELKSILTTFVAKI